MNYYINNNQVFDHASSLTYQGETLYTIDAPEIQAIISPKLAVKELEANERAWRNAELKFADIELLKVQDGDGTGLVSDWRAYRCALRAYPEQADFPNGVRPTFVNTDKE